MKARKIWYRGEQQDDSLMIGNHSDVELHATGKFEIAGLIYCPRYTLKISMSGTGKVTLRGACKRIIVERIKGDCILDIRELSSREFQCHAAQGTARIQVGKTKLISVANLYEQAELKYTGRPYISRNLAKGSGKIERHLQKIKKAA